ncbi:IS3 family transposase [Kribbella sp. NBC_00359]|uniref:IS3 family transposase n=1 Tax=Kribbella sp. NBC_00359 TaxID=2975966 RepID=UPI002E1C48CE
MPTPSLAASNLLDQYDTPSRFGDAAFNVATTTRPSARPARPERGSSSSPASPPSSNRPPQPPPPRPDLIGRDFAVDPDEPAALDTRWCGDITYIHTWEGWLYLATVIDLASRRVVGWATADHLRTDLVAEALTDAVNRRRPAAGLVFHSDRGCQLTSTQYANLARDLGVTLSVGRKDQCWDNASPSPSFFATVKTELIHRRTWPIRKAATSATFDYIEGWCNTRRRHSTLGYLSSTRYESTITVTAERDSLATSHRPSPSKRVKPQTHPETNDTLH